MSETGNPTARRGLLDTSVLIDLDLPEVAERLPYESAISAITLAELAAGPNAADDPMERAIRQQRLQWAEATFDAIPLDTSAARWYGVLVAALIQVGRKPRRRMADLLIAATAAAQELPLYTRNADDFAGLEPTIRVVAI